MKSKILLIIFLISGICSGQSVPNTATFSLQTVVNITGGTSLDAAFTNSNAAYFDPAYGSKTMSPKTLLGFRNYTVFTGVACNAGKTVSVDPASYPETHEVNLGSGTGTVTLTFTPGSVPDLVLVYWNGALRINTNYIGSSDYACGGQYRGTFENYLYQKSDPVWGGTYPNSNYPLCASLRYPTVTSTTSFTSSFSKTTSANIATVYVYPSKSSSGYTFTLSCPQ